MRQPGCCAAVLLLELQCSPQVRASNHAATNNLPLVRSRRVQPLRAHSSLTSLFVWTLRTLTPRHDCHSILVSQVGLPSKPSLEAVPAEWRRLAAIARRCGEERVPERCTVADVVAEIDALAGRGGGRSRWGLGSRS